MPKYRRVKIVGGCFFFTVCLADRRATTLVDRIDDLKAAWRWTQDRLPFSSPAWVVLPDHIHCIWKLPPDDCSATPNFAVNDTTKCSIALRCI